MTTADRSGEWMAPVIPFPGTVSAMNEAEAELETQAESTARAENISLHALTRRAMSVREMEKLLRTRELPDDVIAAEIARLERVGLLDDEALARDLVDRLQRRKGLGSAALKTELVKRLLRPSAIDEAVSEVSGDQTALAIEEARKRVSRLGSLDHETARRRLHAYLARRGFRGQEITVALADALPR